ncbi:glycosyltransferase family 2 protein [Anaerobacillus alkaliphilus]|uniref:Glycosyltransferase family 2 protein n=1 Tax=Anaerobacillus alkaliphilus TaxID=1548597 RepID=A0A4Q0VU89_9BACI|nr:glycosyltransferase family 2 protein [Anaerobacillus alkaliphilus]RXJ02251.1 glycosyltransferase family 2 protein [Anaerobacillus alkaliphilus]
MVNLSIIIPHYNSVALLDKLLKSIPNSKEIQVIVVDDQSNGREKEEFLKLIMKFKKKNVEFHYNNTLNKSAGACRNIGLNQAIGKWLLFADSDDYFLEGFYDTLQAYFNTENDVIFFRPISIELDTGKVSDRHLTYTKILDEQKHGSPYSELLLRYRFYVPWSKLLKTSYVKNNDIFFDEVIASNDVMFSTKVGYYMSKFDVSERVIYCVTRSKGSLTRTVSNKVFDARLNVFINYYKFLKNNLRSQDFAFLNISSIGYLISSFRFGVRKGISVFIKLRLNKIRILDLKIFNPMTFGKKIFDFYRKKKKQKKYYTKVE